MLNDSSVTLILLVVSLLLVKITASNPSDSSSIIRRFVDEEWPSFERIAIDRSTGNVYAAGINRLHLLSQDLLLQHTVDLSPQEEDTETCSRQDDKTTEYCKKNFNKALLLDEDNNQVIVCGTTQYGSCHARNLQNISQILHDNRQSVVPDLDTSSTVAFLAPGPPNYPESKVLYIAAEQSSPFLGVPAVASRSLQPKRYLLLAVETFATQTSMRFRARNFPVNYIYGFSSWKFSYFLTQQWPSTQQRSNSSLISKLVRICQSDRDYFSYIEVPISCSDSQGKIYSVAQAASVGKVGSGLASQLNIGLEDDVLFVIFSQSKEEGTGSSPSKNALCTFTLKSIVSKFTENIQSCYKGVGNAGLDYISYTRPCIKIVSK